MDPGFLEGGLFIVARTVRGKILGLATPTFIQTMPVSLMYVLKLECANIEKLPGSDGLGTRIVANLATRECLA